MHAARRTQRLLVSYRLIAAVSFSVAVAAPVHAEEGGSWLQRAGSHLMTGSGKLQTETRAISGFQAISLRGPMQLVLRQGAREAVELRADDNLLALIETRVVDRSGVPTLEIGTRGGSRFDSRNDMTVTIDVLTLNALSVAGSGDVVGEGLKTAALKVQVTGSGDIRLRQLSSDEIRVEISGSGDVGLAGRVARLQVSIAGSGDVDTSGLEAEDVSVSIAGSGDAKVNARKTLGVAIAGSGDVAYTGDASLKSSISGSGSVAKR